MSENLVKPEELTIDELVKQRDRLLDAAYALQETIRNRCRVVPREPISHSQQRVLYLVQGGLTNKEIANRIGCSVQTVVYHITKLLRKHNAKKRDDLYI